MATFPTKSARRTKPYQKVKLPGYGTLFTEPHDSDDAFPPAVASYEVVDGWLVYTGRDGSVGIVVGRKPDLLRWMDQVGRHTQDFPVVAPTPWDPKVHGGAQNVRKATAIAKQVLNRLRVNAKIKLWATDKGEPQGEATGNVLTLTDVHRRGTPIDFVGVKLLPYLAVPAHEAAHLGFNRGGREVMPVLKTWRERTGRYLTFYHALSGDFEGTMEAAAMYVLAPKHMAKVAPEIYQAVARWFGEATGCAGRVMAEQLSPDQYREKRGRCPRGYKWDGEHCVPRAPAEKDPAGEQPPGEEPAGPKQAKQTKPKGPAKPKKPKVVPQGPVAEKTPDNPYGLDEKARGAKTLADLGGLDGLRKVAGHIDPSKYPPPDVDPATVKIDFSGDMDSKAVMVWRDAKGRQQAAYTRPFLGRNAAAKWERVKKLDAKAEDGIRAFDARLADTSLSPRERDAAAIMSLIGKTGLRPGSPSGLKSTGNRGISTLSAENVKVEGGVVTLDFIGKSGKRNQTRVEDPGLAAYLTDRLKGKAPGDLVFEAQRKDLTGVMGQAGLKGFKPKDFRTRMAGKIAAGVLDGLPDPPPPLPKSDKKAKRLIDQRVKQASTAVADQLNNTPAMAKAAYINPALFHAWAQQVGAERYVAASADSLWERALSVTLPGHDKPATPVDPDDEQLDMDPVPLDLGDQAVEAQARWDRNRVVAALLLRGYDDLAGKLARG